MGRLRPKEDKRLTLGLPAPPPIDYAPRSVRTSQQASGLSAGLSWVFQGTVAEEKAQMFPVLPGRGRAVWGMGWSWRGSGTTRRLQQLPGEREPPKISLGTFQLQGQSRGDAESLWCQAQHLWQAFAGWEFAHSGRKLFTVVAMKQPPGEGLWKECVVVRVGCRSDPRTDFPGRGGRPGAGIE